MRVEHVRLQLRAPAIAGTNPPVVAQNAVMRPEFGLMTAGTTLNCVEMGQCDQAGGQEPRSRKAASAGLYSGCLLKAPDEFSYELILRCSFLSTAARAMSSASSVRAVCRV